MNWIRKNWLHGLALLLIAGSAVWIAYIYYSVTVTEQGARGDAFNGMAGPVVAWVAAVLVYLSFQQQYVANQLQKTSLEKTLQQNIELKNYDILDKLLDELVRDYKYFVHKPAANHRGMDEDLPTVLNSIFEDLNDRSRISGSAYFMQMTYPLLFKMNTAYGYVIGVKCEPLHRHMLKLKIDSLYHDYLWPYWNDEVMNDARIASYKKIIEEEKQESRKEIADRYLTILDRIHTYWNTENAYMNGIHYMVNDGKSKD